LHQRFDVAQIRHLDWRMGIAPRPRERHIDHAVGGNRRPMASKLCRWYVPRWAASACGGSICARCLKPCGMVSRRRLPSCQSIPRHLCLSPAISVGQADAAPASRTSSIQMTKGPYAQRDNVSVCLTLCPASGSNGWANRSQILLSPWREETAGSVSGNCWLAWERVDTHRRWG
jgi:hypothetical protein